MTDPQEQKTEGLQRRPLEYIAFWQFLCFVLLICLVWAANTLDFAALIYGVTDESASWYQSWALTAGIIIVGFITVGHTYLQEKRLLRGFITVCSYCHKVQVESSDWQQMEAFVADRSRAEFTHGVCPTCYDRVVKQMEKQDAGKAP